MLVTYYSQQANLEQKIPSTFQCKFCLKNENSLLIIIFGISHLVFGICDSFSKYLLCTYYKADTILSIGNVAVNETNQNHCLNVAYILMFLIPYCEEVFILWKLFVGFSVTLNPVHVVQHPKIRNWYPCLSVLMCPLFL